MQVVVSIADTIHDFMKESRDSKVVDIKEDPNIITFMDDIPKPHFNKLFLLLRGWLNIHERALPVPLYDWMHRRILRSIPESSMSDADILAPKEIEEKLLELMVYGFRVFSKYDVPLFSKEYYAHVWPQPSQDMSSFWLMGRKTSDVIKFIQKGRGSVLQGSIQDPHHNVYHLATCKYKLKDDGTFDDKNIDIQEFNTNTLNRFLSMLQQWFRTNKPLKFVLDASGFPNEAVKSLHYKGLHYYNDAANINATFNENKHDEYLEYSLSKAENELMFIDRLYTAQEKGLWKLKYNVVGMDLEIKLKERNLGLGDFIVATKMMHDKRNTQDISVNIKAFQKAGFDVQPSSIDDLAAFIHQLESQYKSLDEHEQHTRMADYGFHINALRQYNQLLNVIRTKTLKAIGERYQLFLQGSEEMEETIVLPSNEYLQCLMDFKRSMDYMQVKACEAVNAKKEAYCIFVTGDRMAMLYAWMRRQPVMYVRSNENTVFVASYKPYPENDNVPKFEELSLNGGTSKRLPKIKGGAEERVMLQKIIPFYSNTSFAAFLKSLPLKTISVFWLYTFKFVFDFIDPTELNFYKETTPTPMPKLPKIIATPKSLPFARPIWTLPNVVAQAAGKPKTTRHVSKITSHTSSCH